MSSKKPNTNTLLFNEFKSGNQKAFRKLFELFWEPMFLNAKSIVLDTEVSKDIVQNVWTRIWENRAVLNIKNFEGYIYKAVKYSCYKHLRDNKFSAVHVEALESLYLQTNAEANKQHDLEAVQLTIQNSLKRLTPRCQQIFKLSKLEDISNEEIAANLGISKRSVENQIAIALKSIRQSVALSKSSLTTIFIFISSLL